MHTTVKLTASQYLEWEARQERKHEYYYGETVEMPGTKKTHNKIVGNCAAFLRETVLENGCEIYTEDVKLRVDPQNIYTYPDLMITCEPEIPGEDYFVDKPELIIEVLSESTTSTDRGDKLIYYRRLNSLKQYIIIWQEKMRAEVYSRTKSNEWIYEVYEQPTEVISLSYPELDLPLSVIYSRVTFDKSAM